jgi:hypothetical protein
MWKDNCPAGTAACAEDRSDRSACVRICLHLEPAAGLCQPVCVTSLLGGLSGSTGLRCRKWLSSSFAHFEGVL